MLVAAVVTALVCGPGAMVAAQSESPAEDSERPDLMRDIAYGDDPEQVVHLWELEPRAEPRPAVVFFHGGRLVMGDPMQDAYTWALPLAEQGYVTFLAGYRLFDQFAGENHWPAQLDDAQRAIRWIRANADRFNVDPDRICAVGHSSGAHLAGLLGTTESGDSSDPVLAGISSRVDCVVTVAGHHDLLVPYPGTAMDDVMGQMLGGTLEEVPEAWRAASPAHHVDGDTVPFLILHGSQDDETPVEMARNMADALGEAGKAYVYAEFPAGHFGLETSEAGAKLIEAFLAAQLHPDD
jgi:acetyl esterase/lipase